MEPTSQPDGERRETWSDGEQFGNAFSEAWSDGKRSDERWSDSDPTGEAWSDHDLPAFEPTGLRHLIPGCLLGVLGSSLFAGALLVGFMTLLSGLTLEGCSFDFCQDECLDDPAPLVAAAAAGDLDALEDAQSHDASDVTTASRCALRFAQDEAAAALLAHGPADRGVIGEAARLGAVAFVTTALEQGMDAQDVLDVVVGPAFDFGLNLNLFGCEDGDRVERQASIGEQRAMVHAAVAAGADPNGHLAVDQIPDDGALAQGPDEGGSVEAEISPLLRAAFSGRGDLVVVLLEVGADPDHGGAVPAELISAAQ